MRWIAFVVAFAWLTTSVMAQEASVGKRGNSTTKAMADILTRSQAVLDKAAGIADTEIDPADVRNVEEAARIAREAARLPLTPSPGDAARFRPPPLGDVPAASRTGAASALAEQKRDVWIFVSESMTSVDLQAALREASDTGATVVFRGVRKGASIATGLAKMHGLGNGMKPAPEVVIDPRPFQTYSIGVVPAVVVAEDDRYVKVSGLVSVRYAADRFASGAFGDAGSRGPTHDIAEVDMIEEMRARLEGMDWAEKKRQAIARAWNNFQLVPLPPSQATSARLVDPSVVIGDDITLPDGRLLAAKGTTFNPLDIVPFSKTLIVINATDPRQLAFAKTRADAVLDSNRGVVVMTTEVERSRGWEAFAEYSRFLFPHRLYLLPPEIAARFQLATVPSVVKAEGSYFRVTETAVAELK